MMTTQISSIGFNLILVFEIMYLFTCGQEYLKANVRRARRLFWVDRIIYVGIGIVSILVAYNTENPTWSDVFKAALIASYFGRKCLSVYRYRQGLKRKR